MLELSNWALGSWWRNRSIIEGEPSGETDVAKVWLLDWSAGCS